MHIAVDEPGRVEGLLLFDSLGGIGDGGRSTMDATIQARIGDDAIVALQAIESDETVSGDERAKRSLGLIWPGYFADPASAPPMPDDLALSAAVNEAVMV